MMPHSTPGGAAVTYVAFYPTPLCLRGHHIISHHHPRTRQVATWPAFYKALQDDLNIPLKDKQSWYVTAYDGDTALF